MLPEVISLAQLYIKKKVNSMFTDPEHLQITDPGHVEGNVVFTYLDAFCRDEHFEKYQPDYKNLDEMKDHYRRGGLGDVKCKKLLIAVLEELLEPIRARRKEWEQKIEEVYAILEKGTADARATAAATLNDVREAMKINYFQDKELIAEQAKRYREESAK